MKTGSGELRLHLYYACCAAVPFPTIVESSRYQLNVSARCLRPTFNVLHPRSRKSFQLHSLVGQKANAIFVHVALLAS